MSLPLDPNYTIPGLLKDPNFVYTPPITAKPLYGIPITESTFGTRITRIAGNSGTTYVRDDGSTGTWPSGYARHHYAKDQPWNSDGSLIMLDKGHTVVLDGYTYKPKYGGYSGKYDDRWHPVLPNVRINVRSSGTILEWFDVIANIQLRSWTLPFSADRIGCGEGNVSADGRFVVIASANGENMCIVDMDPQPPYSPYPNLRIGPIYTGANETLLNSSLGAYNFDWATISPSGKYVVVAYDGPYTDHLRLYDVNQTTLAITPRLTPAGSLQCTCPHDAGGNWIYHLGHADVAINPFDANEDVIVGQTKSTSYCPQNNLDNSAMGQVTMVRLKDNKVLSLTRSGNEGSSHHISARNYKRPGWIYATYWYSSSIKRFTSEILAIKMDGSKKVERLAHHHSSSSPYENEPHAVPSPDGRRIIFASGWNMYCGSNCGSSSAAQAYVIDTSPVGDLTHGGFVDFEDFAWFAINWMDTGCVVPDWCDGADLSRSNSVNMNDFVIIADNWLSDSI